ncbi:sensitivity to high expression protein she9 [Taxawa tesnikishii (nom. ined.)]|nr:sensitivity to high expression protein she9 [Dothideales sp. JES 119]
MAAATPAPPPPPPSPPAAADPPDVGDRESAIAQRIANATYKPPSPPVPRPAKELIVPSVSEPTSTEVGKPEARELDQAAPVSVQEGAGHKTELPSTEKEKAGVADATSTEEKLPSHRERQRWDLSKRFAPTMDDLLAKAAIVSHQLNNYTGTDYSGIEALRREIHEQENVVKASHAAVDAAKEAHATAYSQQAASQKEVVGLLERKHSWSAADLERYMSLIRSEHLNEQAVQKAKQDLVEAERSLEEARSTLEKKERKQYHEEQIWSDTIRRNSTWVTFGLMGVNIFLLLVTMVVIEPWRRRRLVREVRKALDEKSAVASVAPNPAVEKQIDQVVEPAGTPLEALERQAVAAEQHVSESGAEIAVTEPEVGEQPEAAGTLPLASGDVLPEEAVDILPETPPTPIEEPTMEQPVGEVFDEAVTPSTLDRYKAFFRDLLSERQVTLKKVDVTTIALEGAAAGIAIMGFLLVLFRPR